MASRERCGENAGAVSSQQARPRGGAQTEADWSAESRGRILIEHNHLLGIVSANFHFTFYIKTKLQLVHISIN